MCLRTAQQRVDPQLVELVPPPWLNGFTHEVRRLCRVFHEIYDCPRRVLDSLTATSALEVGTNGLTIGTGAASHDLHLLQRTTNLSRGTRDLFLDGNMTEPGILEAHQVII